MSSSATPNPTSDGGMQVDSPSASSSLPAPSNSGLLTPEPEPAAAPTPVDFPPPPSESGEGGAVERSADGPVEGEEEAPSSSVIVVETQPAYPLDPSKESAAPETKQEPPSFVDTPPSSEQAQTEPTPSSVPIPSSTTSLYSTPQPDSQPVTRSSSAAVPPTPSEPTLELNLPPGLSSASPSVMRETVAIAAHLKDPEDPNPLLALITSATAQSELEDARAWYEAFLKIYPTASPQLLSYVELELAQDNHKQVEALFSRAFAKSILAGPAFPLAYPPLWTSYLHYIRRQNPLEPVPPSMPNLPSSYLNSRLTITKAYDFALDHIGLDSLSTPIWKEYLQFIKAGETRTTWEEQGKVAELRKVYTRVLKVPVEDIEGIWREYDMFEGQVNKITAKKFLAERSPAYMTARSALKELRTKGPSSAAIFPPPLPVKPTWTDSDRALVAMWKAYIEWEKSNPLELDSDEEAQARVSYVLRKTVGGEGRFFPEIWYTASKYSQDLGKLDEAAGFLRSGVEANPSSFLLTFALAELEESRKDFTKAHALFSSIITRLQLTLEKAKTSIADEIAVAVASVVDTLASIQQPTGNRLITDPSQPDLAEVKRALEEERRVKAEEVKTRREKETEEMEKGVALAWIMYMRFARRAEGIKSARALFQKARKAPHLAWQVYEAAALTEYHCSREPSVATRIFELGLKVYGDKIDFVDCYLSFLITINDDQNARVLFEKSVAKFSPEVARPLWEQWARYEYLFGDISSAQRLDLRFAETFPTNSPTKNLARRHTYIGIDEISRVDLGLGARKPLPTGPRAEVGVAPTPESYLITPPVPTSAIVEPPAPVALVAAASSPAKRSLYSDLPARQASVDRERVEHPDRVLMRNQAGQPGPAKRMRANSPQPAPMIPPPRRAAAPREVSPVATRMRERTPPPHLRPGQLPPNPTIVAAAAAAERADGSLHWFLGELPPVGRFDGPTFRTEDLLGMIGNSAIVPVYPQALARTGGGTGVAAPMAAPDHASTGGGRAGRTRWGP